MLRYLLGASARPARGEDLLSYLAFEPIYVRRVMDLGYADTIAGATRSPTSSRSRSGTRRARAGSGGDLAELRGEDGDERPPRGRASTTAPPAIAHGPGRSPATRNVQIGFSTGSSRMRRTPRSRRPRHAAEKVR